MQGTDYELRAPARAAHMDSSTSTMADQLSISLRAWPSNDKTTESLPYLITRINEQRGSFRSVTEAGLQEEIRVADAHEHGDPVDDVAALGDGPDAKPKKEELSVAREEMIKRVGYASFHLPGV